MRNDLRRNFPGIDSYYWRNIVSYVTATLCANNMNLSPQS
jgi:hypothetical protein